MQSMRRLSIILSALLLLVLTIPTQAQDGNLLNNAGFESTSYSFVSADPLALAVTYNVPAGWGGGVVQSPRSETWMNVHPTGFPHNGPFKLQGNSSFHMSRGGGTFTAYLYQQISVTAGSPLEGGAWAFIENGSGTAIARVGIDPTGGTNPFSGAVVWSANGANGFNWNRMSVSSTAQGNTATLFLFATQAFPVDPNGVYWDEAFFFGQAGSGAVSTPDNTQQPQPPSGQVVTTNVRLNVRSGAGTNFNRIGLMTPSTTFGYVGTEGSWVLIDYNGQTGYVAGRYANITGGQPTGGGETVVGQVPTGGVTLQYTLWYNITLRSGPSRSFGEITTIPVDTVLTAVGRSGDSNWVQVTYNGQTGWVASWLGRWSGAINDLPVIG